MSSDPQESTDSSNFLAFNNKNSRNDFQYRPYNRNRNNRGLHQFRPNNFMTGGRNDGDSQFTPANFSSPVGGQHQQRFNGGFLNNRPHHRKQFQRNFLPSQVII